MTVAQSSFTHVCQLDCALAASVHEPITALRVELCGGNHLGQLFHVSGLDVDNVEALILNVEIPQIDAQIIAANVCFAITVDRNAIDVVSVGVCVDTARHGGNNGVVVCHAREGEIGDAAEVLVGCSDGTAAVSSSHAGRGQVLREVVFGHDLERLLKDLP